VFGQKVEIVQWTSKGKASLTITLITRAGGVPFAPPRSGAPPANEICKHTEEASPTNGIKEIITKVSLQAYGGGGITPQAEGAYEAN